MSKAFHILLLNDQTPNALETNQDLFRPVDLIGSVCGSYKYVLMMRSARAVISEIGN